MTLIEKLIQIGCKEWKKNDQYRIYLNAEHFDIVYGVELRYEEGTKKAYLNGNPISKNKLFKLRVRTIYFDVYKNIFVGCDMQPDLYKFLNK